MRFLALMALRFGARLGIVPAGKWISRQNEWLTQRRYDATGFLILLFVGTRRSAK
jgi:hypothetical protein